MVKKIYKALSILICCLIVSGCRQNSDTENFIEIIDVESNLNNYSDKLKLTDIAAKIEYIALETNENSILDDIRYIDLTETHILIKTKSNVQLYDKKGKYLREIGHKGNGPFEYLLSGVPRIFNDTIFMPTISPSNIFVYTINGEPSSSIPISWKPNPFGVIDDNWFYVSPNFLIQVPNKSGKEEYRIIKVDHNGEVVNEYPNTTFFNGPAFNVYSTTIINQNQFYSTKKGVMYKEILNDTLWQVSDNTLDPKYIFKTGKYGIQNYQRGLTVEESIKEYYKCIFIKRVFESENFILFSMYLNTRYPFKFHEETKIVNGHTITPNRSVLGYFNKVTKETFFIKPTNTEEQIEPTGIFNDYDGGINFFPQWASNDSIFISSIEAYELKEYISTSCFKNSKPKYPEKKKELEELANSLSENDNLVLMVVKLKE